MITKEREKVLDDFISNYAEKMRHEGIVAIQRNRMVHAPSKTTEERQYIYRRLKSICPRVTFLCDAAMPEF